ncbi:hypothetical protein ZWY2020_037910 [Hordeum vulgare]|nr:hypothetical protein ZWY2020_037910 [Hordeum vulgare]
MLHRMPLSRLIPRENAEGTVPDSAFISRASSSQALIQTTIATNYDNLTMKLMQMKRDKERKIVARRDATLEAMNGMAERSAEEAEATRQEISMMKGEKTERTIRVPREKKAEETTAKQEATTTRKGALQQEKEASAIEAILARAEAALKKKEDQEAKIVVPALKRKEHQEANKKQQEEAKIIRDEHKKQSKGQHGYIVDSHIDLQDDNDLFDNNVDFEKGKAVQEEPDDPIEYGDMCLHDSDEDKVQDFGCTMLHRMPLSRLIPRENAEGTVPDSAFISRASSSQALIQTTIATNYDNLTMKLMQMKRDKERKIVARRDATLEAMNGMAERSAEEAEATRQEISMMKGEKTERTIRVPREKKAEETTAKQEATTTRKGALQQEKEASAIEAILARAEAALKKKEDQEAKIVVPALKRKEHQEANKKQQEEAKIIRDEHKKQSKGQHGYVQDFGCTMLHRMPLSRLIPRENAEGTVPDSAFISRASSSQALIQTTIATNYGNLTMKLMQMKRDKERKIVARRDATLEAMNGMAERRAEEAEATRQEISMMKAEQTKRTIRVPREKKVEETTAKQEATTRRKAALQQEKEASAIEAILARAQAALKKKEDQEAKIVVPALKRKEHQEENKKQQEEAKIIRDEHKKQSKGPHGYVRAQEAQKSELV